MNNQNSVIERVLVSEKEIADTVSRLADEINKVYENSQKALLVICILKGSVVFFSDLIRKIKVPLAIDFMQVSSYGSNTVSCGNVNLRLDLQTKDLSEYNLLVIEDILDSGNTLSCILKYLSAKGAQDVKLCTLLDKPDRRKVPVDVDFSGVIIPDEFVVGYGLDYDENYRELPYIGVLKPEVYQN